MKYFNIILLFLIFTGCDNDYKEKTILFDKEISSIIDSYIEKNPLKILILEDNSSNSSLFSYPSYHIYFNKKNMDTIISVIQYPHLHEFEPIDIYNNTEVNTDASLYPDGFIKYKEKYPLVFFKINNYYNQEKLNKYLVKKIPDSLKYNGLNNHIKFVRWDYKIKNKKFIRIR